MENLALKQDKMRSPSVRLFVREFHATLTIVLGKRPLQWHDINWTNYVKFWSSKTLPAK
jgi:hypothetical protein